MNNFQKAFIQRHLISLIEQKHSGTIILEKSLSILNDTSITQGAVEYFEKSGSLVATLNYLKVIQLEPKLLNIIQQHDNEQTTNHAGFITLLAADDVVAQTFSLLKTRLTVGLSYAMWLSIVATIVFSVINLKVLPQFEEIFAGFGAELPQATQFALSWQNSFLSPMSVGITFMVFIGYLLVSLRLLSKRRLIEKQSGKEPLFFKIPFIKSVVDFSKNIHWFSQINLLSATGLSLQQCLDELPFPNSLNTQQSNMKAEMFAAEKIGSLAKELEYQTQELTERAEKIVTHAARNLITVIMVFVFGFVVFTLFASYLPIFQLGAVV